MSIASASAGATHRIVLLLAAAVFLNYFDRGALATAAPLVKGELALSNAEMGILFSAFFWSYAPLQPLAGWLAQRFDVRWVLGGGLALWGTATALVSLANGFWLLLALRVLLGVGESVAYPCNAKFLGQRAAPHERGRANGLIATGQALGPLAGTLVGGLVMAEYGWRPAFLAFGFVSLLWLIPWQFATRGGAARGPGSGEPLLPYGVLLRERALWGTSLGHFCSNYAYYFMLSWLPLLLVSEYGYSMEQMALLGSAVFALQAISAQATGWACDRALLRGQAPNRVLKRTMILGLLGTAVPMAACAFSEAGPSVAWILVAGVFFGVQSAPLGAITQTLGGPRAAGQWMGIQNFCANLAGVTAPLLTGLVVDATGGFLWAFVIAAAVTATGAAAYGIVIRRVEPVIWPSAGSPEPGSGSLRVGH
jgi:MFS family permease